MHAVDGTVTSAEGLGPSHTYDRISTSSSRQHPVKGRVDSLHHFSKKRRHHRQKNHQKEVEKILKKTMESVSSSEHHMFSIPLDVNINSGNNWDEAH